MEQRSLAWLCMRQRLTDAEILEAVVKAFVQTVTDDPDRAYAFSTPLGLLCRYSPETRPDVAPALIRMFNAIPLSSRTRHQNTIRRSLAASLTGKVMPRETDLLMPVFKQWMTDDDEDIRFHAIRGIRRLDPDFDVGPVLRQVTANP
jgi:hypothetical protein